MPGTRTELARGLFAALGPTYDRYANLLSFGQDPRWRRFLVSRLEVGPDDTVVDVACGTRGRRARARAAEGLLRGRRRPEPGDARRGAPPARSHCRNEPGAPGRGLGGELPFEDASFDGLTAAYLLRYLDDLPAGLRELARVVRPGATAALLDFGVPPSPLPRLAWDVWVDFGLPLARPRDLARLARGRPLPRRQHPRRSTSAGQCRSSSPPCARPASRTSRPSASASAAAPSSGAVARDRSAAGVLRARPGRLARLRHAAAPALHGLAPELRRDRRLPRAAPLRGPARGRARRLLPRPRHLRARVGRAERPAAADEDPRARARRPDRRAAGDRRRDRDRRSARVQRLAAGLRRDRARARRPSTTSSCSAARSTTARASRSPGAPSRC